MARKPGVSLTALAPAPRASSGGARPTLAGLDALLAPFVESVADAVTERLTPLLERPTAPTLLDRRGLAAALDVGLDTVDKLRAQGLPTVWVIESPRFELERCLAFLRERSSP